MKPAFKNGPEVIRKDATESLLRLRALDTAAEFTQLENFNVYTAGYLQALKDMKVEKKYIEIYKKVIRRLRNAYEN